jgi:hypothetical protein
MLEAEAATISARKELQEAEAAANPDPMDHDATAARQQTAIGDGSEEEEESLCKKPAQRLVCRRIASIKRKILKHYVEAQAEYNAVLETSKDDEEGPAALRHLVVPCVPL